jgi:hypothetical protein
MKASIVMLGASTVTDGVPTWQASSPVENDNDDVESYGEIPVFCGIGFASYPAPKTDAGWAEAIVLEGVGGLPAVVIGSRDTRDVGFLGRADGGDSFMYSTGANKAVQFRAQDKKRMGAIVVRDADGKDQIFLLDGKNKKFTLMLNGAAIQVDSEGDIALNGAGGAAITLEGGTINLNGEIKIPGMPPGMHLMAGPLTGVVGTVGAAVPVMGVGGFTFSGLLAYAALALLGWAYRFAYWACASSSSRASRSLSPA